MAAQSVRWAWSARADLLEALEYLHQQSPGAAATLFEQAEAAARSLTGFPERGSKVKELDLPDIRQLIVGRYRLVYRVEADQAVGIAALIHGSQDFLSAWRKRPREGA